MTTGTWRYPMVEPGAATGKVAAVYAQIAEVMPIVPSLFKSLAACPPYLALAWDQAAPALRDDIHLAAATASPTRCAPPPCHRRTRGYGRRWRSSCRR
ncbi:MAG: hypothetical protein GEV07_18030 [Streptosporangiales bacterium]|nr:hypothetical protein [Streptosporangiales bacterium]